MRLVARSVLVVAAVALCGTLASAQVAVMRAAPVYADDSPLAAEAIRQAPALVASGNESEAVRSLQSLLETRGHKVVADPDDLDLFETVRTRVHGVILSEPGLLGWYREVEGPRAEAMLASGLEEEVERTRLLTSAGFEACLRVAQLRLEAGRFDGAMLSLMQLSVHPDLETRGVEASRLLGLVGAYLEREDVIEIARSWAELGGLDAGMIDAMERSWRGGATSASSVLPVIADVHGVRNDRMEGDFALGSVHPQPVATRSFDIGIAGGTQSQIRTIDERGRRTVRDVDASGAWSLPVLVDDLLLLNTGTSVEALDRLTLAPRWRSGETSVDPQAARRTRQAILSSGSSELRRVRSVGVGEGILVATLGEGYASSVVGMSVRDGRVLWRWTPEIGAANAVLEVDGAPVVSDGVAIIGVSVRDLAKRAWTQEILGIDVRSGEVLWRRLLGSSGLTSFGRMAPASTLARASGGVVYRSDPIGIMSAVEAVTGRVVWVRRWSVSPGQRGELDWPSVSPAPAFVREDVLMLSGDQEYVFRIDRSSGILMESVPGRRIGKPLIVLADETGGLTAYGTQYGARASGGRLLDARRDKDETIFPLAGRPVHAGGWEAAVGPLGVVIRERGAAKGRMNFEAERGSAVVISRGQMVIVGESSLASYLSWEVIPELLRERIATEPLDPSPGLTLASLAFRVREDQVVLEGLDASIAAIERGVSRGVESQVVFDAALGMTKELLEIGDRGALLLAAPLVDRMERVIERPRDRVWLALLRSRVAEASGDSLAAAEAIRGLTRDTEVSTLWWEEEGRLSTVGSVARSRLREIAVEGGLSLLAAAETRAETALSGLGAGADAWSLEGEALSHPVATSSARALLRAGRMHVADGRRQASVRARLEGVRTLRAIGRAGGEIDARLAGELVGSTARDLSSWGRGDEASELIDATRSMWEPTGLFADGAEYSFRSDASEHRGFADVKGIVSPPASVLYGWRLVKPIAGHEGAGASVGVLAGNFDGVWRVGAIRNGEWEAPGWEVAVDAEPRLLWIDDDGLVFLEGFGLGGRLVRRSVDDGSVVWRTKMVSEELGGVSPRLGGWGRVSGAGLVVDAHGGALVIGSLGGRCAGFDLADGSVRWRLDAAGDLTDLVARGGVVAIASRTVDSRSVLQVVDGWSGERLEWIDVDELMGLGRIRWLRSDAGGGVLLGLADGLGRLDFGGGNGSWRTDDEQVRGAVDAWGGAGHAVVMGSTRELVVLDLGSGRVRALPGTLQSVGRGGRIWGFPRGDQTFIGHASGVFNVDGAARASGQMRLAPGRELDQVSPTASGWVGALVNPASSMVVDIVRGGTDGRLLGRGVTLRLRLGGEIDHLAVIDGAVLVGTDAGTVVISTDESAGE